MNWMGWTALGIGGLVLSGAFLVVAGNARWARGTQAQMALLEAARVSLPAARYDALEIDGLPAGYRRELETLKRHGPGET